MRSSPYSAPLFSTRGCLYINLLVLSVRSLANDSYTQRNKTDLILRAIENDLFANESRKHGYNVSRHLSNLLSQFEIEKGRMPPSLRREYRDRFLRLATRLSDKSRAIALLLADTAFKLPEGNISVGHAE